MGRRWGGVVGEERGWEEWGWSGGCERCMENMDTTCKLVFFTAIFFFFLERLINMKIMIIEWRGRCTDRVCPGERITQGGVGRVSGESAYWTTGLYYA